MKAIQPEKKRPPIGENQGLKTEKTGQNYAGLIQAATLPFRRDGFDHELIEQTGRVRLVKRSKNGRQLHFEVTVMQPHAARQWPDGRLTPAGWHYPSSECWGEAGWTYTDLAEARRRYLSESRKQGVSVAEAESIARSRQALKSSPADWLSKRSNNRENAPYGERRAA